MRGFNCPFYRLPSKIIGSDTNAVAYAGNLTQLELAYQIMICCVIKVCEILYFLLKTKRGLNNWAVIYRIVACYGIGITSTLKQQIYLIISTY